MTLLNSTISSNSVTAGNGGDGGSGGSPAGVGGDGGNGYIGVAGAVALLKNEAASFLHSTLVFNSVVLSSGGSGGAAGPGGTAGTGGSAGSATAGGVSQSGGSINGQSTIFADNTAGSDASDYFGAITASGCLFGSTSGATITAGLVANVTGVDPMLGPLQDNGGPTFTHALLAGSPAIGAGDITNAPTYDQRGTGYPRLSMGKTDIGALETQPMPSFTVQWSSNQVILTNTSGIASAIALSTTTNPMEFDITSADPIAVTEVASAGNFTITNDGFGDVTVTLVAPGAVPTQFTYVGDAQDDVLTLGTDTETFDLNQFGPSCGFVMDTTTTPGGSDSLTIDNTVTVSGSGNFTTTTNAGGGNSLGDIGIDSSGRILTATGSVNLSAGSSGTGFIDLNCPDGQSPITSPNISLNAASIALDNGTLYASGLAIATSTLSIGDNSGPANSTILCLEGNNQIQQGSGTDIEVYSDGRLDLNGYRQPDKDLWQCAGSTVITYAGSLTLDGDSYVEVPQAKNTAMFSGKLLLGPGAHTYWTFTVNQSAVMAFGPLLTTPGVDLDISGSVSDDSAPGGLTINLPGVIQLSGSDASDDYNGGTSVDDGTLLLDHTGGTIAIPGDLTIGDGTGDPGSALVQWLADSQMDSTGNVTLLSDGQLDLNGFNQTLASLDFTGGSVTTEAGILTLTGNVTTHASASQASITGELDYGANTPTFTVADGGNGQDMVVNAVLDGTGAGLTKEGAGELVLMGSAGAGFTGLVDIAAGRLDIGGQYASIPATVEAGATLGGVNLDDPTQPGDLGAVTVDAGGTLSVGSTAQTGILGAERNSHGSERHRAREDDRTRARVGATGRAGGQRDGPTSFAGSAKDATWRGDSALGGGMG